MNAFRLMEDLRRRGITLEAAGGKLRWAPKDALVPEEVDELRDHKAEILALLSSDKRALSAVEPSDLPFPLGYGGMPKVQVELAEVINDVLGVTDPVYRRLNVLSHLWYYFREAGEKEMAAKSRAVYHMLRHGDHTITASCGICEYATAWPGDATPAPPADVENLLVRLRKGMAWLIEQQQLFISDGLTREHDERFSKALDHWAGMETQLRAFGYQDCVMRPKECPQESPARCRVCAHLVKDG